MIASNQINRYSLEWKGDYININPKILFSGGYDEEEINKPKLLIRRTGDFLIVALDESGYYHTNALIYGVAIKKIDLRFIMGILNSKLLKYYYRKITMKEGRTFPQVEIDTINKLSLKFGTNNLQAEISKLVNRMLSLNKKLQEIGDKNTLEKQKIEQEIKKTDSEIDELVYQLYGITNEEKKIIEESLR